MISRFWSAGNYLLDAFVISLVLVFINNETAFPLAWMWLIFSVGAAILSYGVFLKFTYHLWGAMIIAGLVLAAAITGGAPLWLAAVMGMLTLYRLHARFSLLDDFDSGGNFLLIFVLVFAASLVIGLFNPQANSAEELYTIVIAAIVFYVLFRLMYRYLQTRLEGVSLSMAALAALGIIGLAAMTGSLVYFLAEDVRKAAGLALGTVVQIVLWPFAGLLEKITEYLSGLSTEQEMADTLAKLEPEKAVEEAEAVTQPAAVDFPLEFMLMSILAVFFIFLIWRLLKVRPEKELQTEKSPVEIKRYIETAASAKQLPSSIGYSAMEMQLIREAYRNFEKEAEAAGQGRKEFETVREWMGRMKWPVSDSFFNIYDLVRYGAGNVQDAEAQPFLAEIQKIKEEYFKEEV